MKLIVGCRVGVQGLFYMMMHERLTLGLLLREEFARLPRQLQGRL